MIRTDVNEPKEATMARFFEGLNDDVQEKTESSEYNNLQDLVHHAVRSERLLQRQAHGSRTTHNSTWSRPQQQGDDIGASSKVASSHCTTGAMSTEVSKTASNGGKEASKADPSAISSARTSNVKCFKCKGRGHMMHD